MLYFSYYFHLKLKDEAMKVNVLLIFFATMGILCADGISIGNRRTVFLATAVKHSKL